MGIYSNSNILAHRNDGSRHIQNAFTMPFIAIIYMQLQNFTFEVLLILVINIFILLCLTLQSKCYRDG